MTAGVNSNFLASIRISCTGRCAGLTIGTAAIKPRVVATTELSRRVIASAHLDLPGHLGMKRAKVPIRAGRLESMRERVVGVERRRLEFPVGVDDGVRDVVAVGPGDRRSTRERADR